MSFSIKMEQYIWILWLVLGVILIIAEIFTLGFVLFWFGLGAIAAALAGLFGLGMPWQFGVFVIVSVGMTAMSRTLFSRYFSIGQERRIKMGVESMPGQIGTVTIGSQGALNEGAVKVYGSTWTAFPMDGETRLVEGEKVEVVEVRGSSIFVRRASDALPDWRGD